MTESDVLRVADFIIENNSTVRSASENLGISKSCIHLAMRKKLRHIDIWRYEQIDAILTNNLSERHLRGGLATRKKYKKTDKTPTEKNAVE